MASSTILVIALHPLDLSHAARFVAELTGRNEGQMDARIAAGADEIDCKWTISNKYYIANVDVRSVDTMDAIDAQGEEPAVIVLVSRNQSPPASLSPLLKQLLAKRDDEGFEVALLVTIDDSYVDIDAIAWEDIAIDHQLEWIDILTRENAEKEERLGMARIVEALHSHLWDGLVRVEQHAQDRTTTIDTDAGSEMQSMGSPPLPSPRPFVPVSLSFPSTFLPSISRPSHASAHTVTGSTEHFDDDFAPFAAPTSEFDILPSLATRAAQKDPPLPSSLDFTSSNHFLILDEGDEQLSDDLAEDEKLASVFSRLAGWREEAKGLGMDERRNLAAKVLEGLI